MWERIGKLRWYDYVVLVTLYRVGNVIGTILYYRYVHDWWVGVIT